MLPASSAVLTRLRQVIEPVIGQLATRFLAEPTWARELWHLCGRITREVLGHIAAVLLNRRAGNPCSDSTYSSKAQPRSLHTA